LKLAGIPAEHLVIWDKANRDLKRGGFEINTGKTRGQMLCTDALVEGYESEPSMAGQVGSLFSTILSQHCTALLTSQF